MKTVLFWLRRDLRVEDNHGLYQALTSGYPVVPVFVFDTTILANLPKDDKRVNFIYGCITSLKSSLQAVGKELVTVYGDPTHLIPQLAQQYNSVAVYTNRDYEPQTIQRDQHVAQALQALNCQLVSFKDQCIFEAHEVLSQQKTPYTVFTPYKKNWLKSIQAKDYQAFPSESLLGQLASITDVSLPSLASMGFETVDLGKLKLGEVGAKHRFHHFFEYVASSYDKTRDTPSVPGTSFLSVYNRFGCISIRYLVRYIYQELEYRPEQPGLSTWLSELIWRDFYFQILYHFPYVSESAFKTDYQNLAWENNTVWFDAWKLGKTGFPIVDAAMRQLNQTGYMHNRMRMLVASFLTKDLLIDYRWGEAYFAEKLLDFDLSANNGGWQWAASTGCDAQPYFRIFNPSRQSQTFDPDAHYIKKYVPELNDAPAKFLHEPWKYQVDLTRYGVRLGQDYPCAIIEHDVQREKALALFKIKE